MPTSTTRNTWLADQPLQRKIVLAIGALLALFVATSLVNLGSIGSNDESRSLSSHTYVVLLTLADVSDAARARQAAVRGYLLSRDEGEYADFEAADAALSSHLATLRQLTSDNPLQQSRLDRLEDLFGRWRGDAVAHALRPMRAASGDPTPEAAAARETIRARYFADRSVTTDDMRKLIDTMSSTERALLDARNAKVERQLRLTRWVDLGSLLACLAFGLFVIRMTARLVTRPIVKMTSLMTRLAGHDHTVEVRQLTRGDEIGEMARALQIFKEMAIESDSRTWLKSSVASISNRLQQATNFGTFAGTLMSELAPRLGAGLCAFYAKGPETRKFELLGSYGYKAQQQAPRIVEPGAGLVGQAALERHAIVLNDVPDNYTSIHSATGEAPPRSVVLMPVISREDVLGVIEVASFTPLTDVQRELLDELMPIVALSLENLRRTAELQEQSQRLMASEEELRVQAEELYASNEELREKGNALNRQNDALEALQRETQEKAEELARASRYKSEFLANMSHELRTPLNSLLILSRSLADNDENNLTGEQVESARIIHDAGSSLLRLINDILDLSKVEAGKMELAIETVSLADLVRTLGRTFNHVARDKKLSFEIRLSPELPATIRTDGGKLEQVVNNLLSNAFKFTSRGGVDVDIARPARNAPLPAGLDPARSIAIAVKDSGIGIPADKFQRVFHAFEQVDASTSRQFGGTGLGLAISRRIAALLGGDIALRSEPGDGSTFTVYIPEDTPEPDGRPEAIPPQRAAAEATLPVSPALLPEGIDDDRASIEPGDTVILVVEDDPAFARILADMIRRKGYRVLAATDGESGLALARRHRPTGILLDVMLPGMDGWTVIERLKADLITRHIPVHFISATDDAKRGLELGAVGFLTKPVSRESIIAAFDRLVHFSEDRTRQVLVVDDDAGARAAVRTLLKDDEVTIDEAGTGEDALAMTAGKTYDCIVLDLGLPGMSGFDFLEQLSQRGTAPPVVVYSGRDLSREESMRIRRHTDSIVLKGARSPDRLLDEVSLFLHSIRQGASPTAGTSHAASADSEAALQGRRVLLVDDDMRNLFALSKVLRGKGIDVTMAQDGRKALDMLDKRPDLELVLMDVMMPGMDGYETMREIRARPDVAHVPVIALTAKAMRGDRERCLEAGANDYLAKPIDVNRLLSMIRAWLPPLD